MDKRFFLVLGIILVILGGLLVFTRNEADAPGSGDVVASNHRKGGNSANVELVVYGDFECSACVLFFPVEKQVVEIYLDKISFVFKHFVLDNMHPNARAAARAAEAAGMQNKFFEMHDMLYENQESWLSSQQPLQVFESFANLLKLDVEKFKTDFASEQVNKTINADYKEGLSKNVAGTPTYFLNGTELDNADLQTVEQFSLKIEEAINNSTTD